MLKNINLGFLGFLGFFALKYFHTGDINDLGFLAFFGFFSDFFIGKIKGNRTDERYFEDVQKAKAFMANILIVQLGFIIIIGNTFINTHPYLLVMVSACFAISLIAYAVKLYILEEK